MRICITGANSFIGRPLVTRALLLGWDVVAVVRNSDSISDIVRSFPKTEIVELSLNEYDRLGDAVGKVDCAVLLAWNGTRGQTRMNEELQQNNYAFNMAGLKGLIAKGCKRIVTAGSQAEYGLHNGMITEDTECKPNTAYGKYKLRFYLEAYQYCRDNGVSLKEPRFFSLYGPGDYENTMIMSSVKAMLLNEKCNFTEATQKWDYLYLDDAVEAVAELCYKECPDGVYNFGSGDCRSLRAYIEEQREVLNSSSDLQFGAIPYGPAGKVSIHPSVDKLKRELDWAPRVSFSEGIMRIANVILGKYSTAAGE